MFTFILRSPNRLSPGPSLIMGPLYFESFLQSSKNEFAPLVMATKLHHTYNVYFRLLYWHFNHFRMNIR